MNRRRVLVGGSAVLTTGMLFGLSASSSGCCQLNSGAAKRPDPAQFDAPVLKALALSLSAPSAHNTQAWKFQVLGDREILAFVDEARLLPATDPPSRQIHMGLGCQIETFVIGASRFGFRTEVEMFPEGYTVPTDIGQRPVARLRLLDGGTRDPLERWIEARRTNRKPYDGEAIARGTFDDLISAAGPSSTEVRFLDQGLDELTDLLYRAFEVESRTYATNEETRRMFRFCEAELAERRDGISIPQMGTAGPMRCIAEASLDEGREETWHSDKTIRRALTGIRKGLDSTRALVVWISDANDVVDWVGAGRDYVRFSLAMTAQGLVAHPYNQIIQEYVEMDALRDAWSASLGVSEPRKVQMITRIGRGKPPYVSWRRTVDDVVWRQT